MKPIDRELTVEELKNIAEIFAKKIGKNSWEEVVVALDNGEISPSPEEMRARQIRFLMGG